jgi:hypothetical protein
LKVVKIISGGQTGADRAALDWAIENGLSHGGWCPKGRKSEDGEIAPCYNLNETPNSNYLERTEWNIRDSDGTVIFSVSSRLSGGSPKTLAIAQRLRKPVLHITTDETKTSPEQRLVRFMSDYQIRVLNVAGPRASKEPAVADFVKTVLGKALM